MLHANELTKIVQYCRDMAPYEAGGFIDAFGLFVPLHNYSPTPTEAFYFPDMPPDARAVVHSHPGGPFAPSIGDQVQQRAMDIPWLVVAFDGDRLETFWFGDGAPIAPLVGRGFRHFVTDCYAACRDFYRITADLTLPEYPRRWKWWETDQRLYLDGFAAAGFREVDKAAILPGDAVLMQIHAKTPNHAAIWLGDGLIYHHTSGTKESDPTRLATVENGGRYSHFITAALRNDNDRIIRTAAQNLRAISRSQT